MKTSNNGINLIKKFEGCKLTAYKCPAGVWTIGYGHTAGVVKGMKITSAEATKLLKDDLVKFEKHVMKFNNIYKWTQNEFDALVSFAFNIGSISQLTNNGKRSKTEIVNKIPAYNKAGGQVLSGLTKRRKEEQDLFLSKSNKATPEKPNPGDSTPKHTPIKYELGKWYVVHVNTTLRVRTKKSTQSASAAVNGTTIDYLKNGQKVKNLKTVLVGKKLMMYIGSDSKKRERWVCADDGETAYVK